MIAIAPPQQSWEADTAARWQENAFVAYPLLLLLAFVLVLGDNFGKPLLHDSLAVYWNWSDQFTAELARGNPYPRWLPQSYGGLGSPALYYYPPLAFYLAGLFGLAGFSTYGSLMCTFVAAFAGSGIACWHWLKGRAPHPLLGAAFFVGAPYHVYDYSMRGALPETVGIALIPVIAIGLRRIAERRGGIALTACSYGALIATHLPLALLTGCFFVAPYAFVHRARILSYCAAIAAGIGLASVYLLPALALEPFHDAAKLYRADSLRTAYWSFFEFHFSDGVFVGIFLIVGMLAVALKPALAVRDRWALYTAALLILISGAVPLLWQFPLLEKVQFPYRALPLAEFGLATAIARLPRKVAVTTVVGLLPLSLVFLAVPARVMQGQDPAELSRYHADTYEYLPRGVLTADQTNARLHDILSARIPPPKVPGMIVEPHFYFPAWSCGVEEPRTQLLMHEPGCVPQIAPTRFEEIGRCVSAVTALLIVLISLTYINFSNRKPFLRYFELPDK